MFVGGWIDDHQNKITNIHISNDRDIIMEWLVKTGRPDEFHFSQSDYANLGLKHSHVHFEEGVSAFLMESQFVEAQA